MLSYHEHIIQIWHEQRLELLLLAGIILIAGRLFVYWRQQHNSSSSKELIAATTKPDHENLVESDVKQAQSRLAAPRTRATPKRISGRRKTDDRFVLDVAESSIHPSVQPVVFYFSIGGSTKARAENLAASLPAPESGVKPAQLHDLAEIDYDDYFVSLPKNAFGDANCYFFYIFLIPSYDIDTELANFLTNLSEIHHDFRVDTGPISGIAGYSVLGFGELQEWPTEQDGYCSQAIETDRWMSKLSSGRRAFPIGLIDVKKADVDVRINEWVTGVREIMHDIVQGKGLGLGVVGSGNAYESDEEDQDSDTVRRKAVKGSDDLEDIKVPIPVDFTTTSSMTPSIKAMVPVSSPTYNSLTKQGYSIVGTHSGVKICRWTKSALRGRGSCYKYSFYGIASHRCMEATPSLSCSNKCVFCWRHGTNPVGTTWRWQVDQPDLIFDGIKKEHYKKIKMMRGVPGVRAERFEEGMQIRHCALSLVGEPIFYPHINELLAMLHREHISSFLVCNAQHPDQLAALGPVTQLYVSIDASNKDSLRRIDRPLHRDFWERFIRCMDILREKRNTHRTVFRLTLVKGFNIEEEAEGYAELVDRARPSFVEVKGVTYCGTSTAAGAGLTMQNVPFYEEVTAFVLALEMALLKRGLDYGIGAEHAHSCCILLADRKRYFQVPVGSTDGVKRWHTLIDYDRFFQLLESKQPFGPEDYIGQPTAEWALWGNGGFDPRDARVDRKGRPKIVQ